MSRPVGTKGSPRKARVVRRASLRFLIDVAAILVRVKNMMELRQRHMLEQPVDDAFRCNALSLGAEVRQHPVA